MTVFAVCSLYDIVADTYGRPFLASNKPSAIRSIQAEVNNPQSGMLHDKPGDFRLIYLGTFDDQRADFDLQGKDVLCTCSELVSQPGPVNA